MVTVLTIMYCDYLKVDQLNRLIWKLDQSTELPVLLRASQAYRDRRIRDAMQILEVCIIDVFHL